MNRDLSFQTAQELADYRHDAETVIRGLHVAIRILEERNGKTPAERVNVEMEELRGQLKETSKELAQSARYALLLQMASCRLTPSTSTRRRRHGCSETLHV